MLKLNILISAGEGKVVKMEEKSDASENSTPKK